jgi:hypothetical protein
MLTDVSKDRSASIFGVKDSEKNDVIRDIKNGLIFWNKIVEGKE